MGRGPVAGCGAPPQRAETSAGRRGGPTVRGGARPGASARRATRPPSPGRGAAAAGRPAPEAADRMHARAVDSSVPRDVDDVAARALAGGYPDVDALTRALRRLPAQALDAPDPPRQPGPGVAIRRWAWRVVPPMLVVVIATAGWAIGSDLGRVPQSARTRHAALPAASPAAPGAAARSGVRRTPPQVA